MNTGSGKNRFFLAALLGFAFCLEGCDPNKDLDAYYKEKGLNRLSYARDDLQPGGLIIAFQGRKPVYADNMLDYISPSGAQGNYPVEAADGLRTYQAVLGGNDSSSFMDAGLATRFLAGLLPVDLSSSLKLTGQVRVEPTNAVVHRMTIPTLQKFLSSGQSGPFIAFVRSQLSSPGTSAYVIYETFRTTQLKVSSQSGTNVSADANLKQLIKSVPGVKANVQVARTKMNELIISGDRAYVFAIRTAQLDLGLADTLIVKPNDTLPNNMLGDEKYSAPVSADFRAVALGSYFPTVP